MLYYSIITIVLVLVDQFTKYLTVANLALYETIEFIPRFMSFTYIQNEGAAWSILEGQMWFFYLVTIIVSAVLIYFIYSEGKKDKIYGTILAIILGGTLGNFIDRLFYQYVIDMIKVEFISFPVFNLADSFLTIGVILLFVYSVYLERQEDKF